MQFSSTFRSNFSCMNVKFSPFEQDKLAIACADNFGVAGKGKVIIAKILPGQVQVLNELIEHDAIFDISWSEADPNLLASACGDGEIKLWNTQSQQVLANFHEARDEVQSVEFSHKIPNLLISSHMNGLTRLFDTQAQKMVQVFQTHKGCTYQSTWHPVEGSMFATCGVDGALRLWDLNSSANKNIASIKAHQQDVLSCDFNKYEEVIATSSVDKTVKLWDLRNLKIPTNILIGHRHPVKKIKFSPHESHILASASYDMQVILWNSVDLQAPLIKLHASHTEFVVGIDFNVHVQRQIASASWDGKVQVWQWDQEQPK